MQDNDIRQLLRMPHGLRATYLMWQMGIDPRYTVARETYHRHRRMLMQQYGIDITAQKP